MLERSAQARPPVVGYSSVVATSMRMAVEMLTKNCAYLATPKISVFQGKIDKGLLVKIRCSMRY